MGYIKPIGLDGDDWLFILARHRRANLFDVFAECFGHCIHCLALAYFKQPTHYIAPYPTVGKEKKKPKGNEVDRPTPPPPPRVIGSPNLVWLTCLALVVYIVYGMSVKSLFWPTFSSDALGSFDVLAKGLAHEGKIINSLILEKRVGFGAAYPPLYSLALAYVYMFGFELSKIVPVLFFISFAICFYALLKRLTPPTQAIFFTLFAIATPEMLAQSAINITSVPQAIYAALAVVSIMAWHELKEAQYFYLSALLMSWSCFTRSEGIVYLFPTLLYLAWTAWGVKSYKKLILYFIIAVTPFVLWQLFLKFNIAVMSQYIQVELIKYPNLDFTQVEKIVRLAFTNMTSTQYFGITFYAFIGMILLNGWNIIKKKDNVWLLIIIFLSFFGYLALLNQFKLRADTLDNIVNYSGKRFFFGITFLMWFYVANNRWARVFFNQLEIWLNYKKESKQRA